MQLDARPRRCIRRALTTAATGGPNASSRSRTSRGGFSCGVDRRCCRSNRLRHCVCLDCSELFVSTSQFQVRVQLLHSARSGSRTHTHLLRSFVSRALGSLARVFTADATTSEKSHIHKFEFQSEQSEYNLTRRRVDANINIALNIDHTKSTANKNQRT